MGRRKIDVLIIARPDHSYKIYQALSAQKELSFLYVTFGLFPKWLSFLHLPKLRYVGSNAKILKLYTVFHILHYKLHLIGHFDERRLFEMSIRFLLHRYAPKIIHYWPDYCENIVRNYKTNNPNTVLLAEMYMPNPVSVINEMKTVYSHYGIADPNVYLEKYSSEIHKRFVGADYIVVASKYVENTMKVTYPDSQYLLVPYGIHRSPLYSFSPKSDSIRKFVFAGVVSLEKGVDIICEYFLNHPQYELHLYGGIPDKQRFVFDEYSAFENIYFHGPVSRQQLYEAYRVMDVGIHPSRFDAYSLAVGEEIGSGLPVIVSDKTGNRDDVLRYNWGVDFELNNEQSLEKAVSLVTDIIKYQSMQKSIDQSLSNGTSNYGDAVIDLYENLLENNLA